MDRAPCTRREGTGRAGSGPGALCFYPRRGGRGWDLSPTGLATGLGGFCPPHKQVLLLFCCAHVPVEDREPLLWGLPWVPEGWPSAWERWSITAALSDGPFLSSAALPMKRPPAPTRSTATESASGPAAKPSVRTWDSLSSKCSAFWGRFSQRRGEPALSGWDSMGLAEGETLEIGPDTPKCVCPEQGRAPCERRKHTRDYC